jgi:hypothetical protein
MVTKLGITTVTIDGQNKNILELNPIELNSEWIKLKHEINDLYEVNAKVNQGWRGIMLRLIGVNLPDRKGIILGGINSKGQTLYGKRSDERS